ncbi:unnamed protein product [Allacma fusca]|uniref:Aminopeptidase n=1 Tax=Allacma fusca TaxID=39272 RepID=A0A8J2P496_9HEXA|nr:unnamed protein product [Allacma fusca]
MLVNWLKIPVIVLIIQPAVIFSQFPPLQLESQLAHLTNILQDRDYHSLYEESVPKDKFKGKPQKLIEKLAQGVVPTHYSVFIRPILDDTGNPEERFTAPGIVKISFKCEKPTSEVFVHAVEMTINNHFVQIRNRIKAEENFSIKAMEYIPTDSVYKIVLDHPLDINKEYTLTIAFTSVVSRERMTGLYLSNYTDPATKDIKYIAITQFESIYARKAFPCFDEPDLKATFDVSIGRKLSYNSISNMNLVTTEPIVGLKGWVWDHYDTTPRMSTYLISFIVSEFESATARSDLFGGRPVKTWGQPKFIEEGDGAYAAEMAAKVLSFYETYFDTPYPIPKMDSIGLPHFQAGAMENWGANTYREKLLMYFGKNTTEAERYSITSVISHELAHQNFGDLVTCKRWTHLWLNEGFATYVSFLGVNSVAPEFKPFDLFVAEALQYAMKVDAGPKAHALVNDSVTNQMSNGDFDIITYKKGGSLIRMMQGILGEEALKKGLQQYLHKNAFGNVVTDDLYLELNSQANFDSLYENLTVKEVMDTYTYKPGFPLIRVGLGKASNVLYFTQEKFLTNRSEEVTLAEHWWVPLSIKTSLNSNFEETQPDLWLSKNVLRKQWRTENELFRSKSLDYDWLILNPNLGGYYRVLYDDKLTLLLQEQLVKNHSALPAAARARLIDDYFNAAHADYIPMDAALGFTKHLGEETDYIVWTTTFLNMKKIYSRMRSGRRFDNFNSYFRPRVVSALDRIGWEQIPGEKGLDVLLRANLLDWACNLEYMKCTRLSKRLIKMWMDSSYGLNPIPVDIQPVMICTAVATSETDEVWDFVWKKYQESESVSEKFKLISALSCSRNRTHLGFLVDEAVNTTSRIASVDASVLLQRLAASTIGNDLVFGKIKTCLGAIVNRFGGAEQVAYAISTLSIYWNDPEHLDELQEFVVRHSDTFKPVMKLLKSSIKIVEDNIRWLKRFEKQISHWLEENRGPIAAASAAATVAGAVL